MKKYMLLVLILAGVGILIYSQSSQRLPIYRIKNNSKNMVDFSLELSAAMQKKVVNDVEPTDLAVYNAPEIISLGIQPEADVPNLFDLIQDPERLLPIPEMIARFHITFYEKQYQWSTQSDPLGEIYLNGPLPVTDTTFVLNGPNIKGNYSITMQ